MGTTCGCMSPQPISSSKAHIDRISTTSTLSLNSSIPVEFTTEKLTIATNKCNINICSAVLRIKYILIHQTDEMKEYGAFDFVNCNLGEYSNTILLNDFHHLMFEHDFEQIYNKLLENDTEQICRKSVCRILQRNRRDRSLLRKHSAGLNNMYFDVDPRAVILQQIMDSFHCFYFHSLDTGYKLSSQDKTRVLEICDNDVNDENQRSALDKSLQHINQIINKKSDKSDNTNTMKFSSILETEYSFGLRFFYWDFYKDYPGTVDFAWLDMCDTYFHAANPGYTINELYVPPKYKNLGEEMTKNEIYCISPTQWLNHVSKATIHSKTDYFKSKNCVQDGRKGHYNRNQKAFLYGVKAEDPIKIEHIAVIMIHCNEDTLNTKFSETFRMKKNEDVKILIKNHSHFAHFGRLLRECVELYGDFCQNAVVYHGISSNSTFASANARIKGPFSTTTEYAVALNFANNEGIILELFVPTQFLSGRNAFFCQSVSDFKNEKEIFFIGGTQRFQFLNIFNVYSCHSYKLYAKSLNVIDRNLGVIYCNFILNKHIDKTEEKCIAQIVFMMLSHELNRHYPQLYDAYPSIPKYIQNLLHHHFQNITNIEFSVNHFYSKNIGCRNIYWKLFRSIFFDDYGCLKLPLLIKLFPHIMHIELEIGLDSGTVTGVRNIDLINNRFVFLSMLRFLEDNQNNPDFQLEIISIGLNDQSEHEIAKKIIEPFRSKFQKLNWKLYVNDDWGKQIQSGLFMQSMMSRKHEELSLLSNTLRVFSKDAVK
eukprot:85940_1